MMSKKFKITYTTVKVLFSLMILFGTALYFFNYDLVASRISNLGYPTYIIYPLGILKILGVITIWMKNLTLLKEWAYAGFVFVLTLGVAAHVSINDNEFMPALLSLILGSISYYLHRKEQVVVKTQTS